MHSCLIRVGRSKFGNCLQSCFDFKESPNSPANKMPLDDRYISHSSLCVPFQSLQVKVTSSFCGCCSCQRLSGQNKTVWSSGFRNVWGDPRRRSLPCRAPWPREPPTTRVSTLSWWTKSAKPLAQRKRLSFFFFQAWHVIIGYYRLFYFPISVSPVEEKTCSCGCTGETVTGENFSLQSGCTEKHWAGEPATGTTHGHTHTHTHLTYGFVRHEEVICEYNWASAKKLWMLVPITTTGRCLFLHVVWHGRSDNSWSLILDFVWTDTLMTHFFGILISFNSKAKCLNV